MTGAGQINARPLRAHESGAFRGRDGVTESSETV
jgi:hypothetical protein